ncbi:MAG TPA: efflux RND transporter periplasmic adaptor subunit [Hyphomicrobiaceae bacterium]|nr:efflux RND transporter periplasmic adaptor subunit [Hyphomicrobiaceae bacterium]
MLKRAAAAVLVCALLGAGLLYWQRGERPSAAASPRPATPPPPQVGVLAIKGKSVPLTFTYAGRVAGFRDVEIRAQVSGTLLKREFSEGARVKHGDVLFRIDPRTYEVALDRAKAQLAQAEATLRQATENWKRVDELVKRQVSTEKQHDDARAALEQATASVQLSQAEVRNAELNVGYTTITSPVTGVTRLVSPPEGSLVLAQQTVLTSITQLDPAYVNFSFTDSEYQAARDLSQRLPEPIARENLSVELQYGNGAPFAGKGKIDASANRVDTQTGTIQARAIFANQDGALLPGQFVRIVVKGVTLPDAIVIPRQAVSQGTQGPFVYAVGPESKAQVRPVKLGQEVDEGWIVDDGLKDGDTIVVEGVMRVRPGAPVSPAPMAGQAERGAQLKKDRP